MQNYNYLRENESIKENFSLSLQKIMVVEAIICIKRNT